MKTQLIILFFATLYFTDSCSAQISELASIRICKRYDKGPAYILEYNLKDSSFSYQKKHYKKIKELESKPSEFFLDSTKYFTIDSMFNNFKEFQSPCDRKMNQFRVDLVYESISKSNYRLCRKIKTYNFPVSNHPKICDDFTPTVFDSLITEYYKVRRAEKLNMFFGG